MILTGQQTVSLGVVLKMSDDVTPEMTRESNIKWR